MTPSRYYFRYRCCVQDLVQGFAVGLRILLSFIVHFCFPFLADSCRRNEDKRLNLVLVGGNE